MFPFRCNEQTCIREDRGKDDEYVIDWHCLDGEVLKIAPWLVEPKRPMGCQYINVHNDALSRVLNCNTNVQIGDVCQVYYSTLYNIKNNQKEDSERQDRVNNAIHNRILRIDEELMNGTRSPEEVQEGFTEGLCRMLGALNASTSRFVVGTTMAHLMVCQGGTRFKMSHSTGNLLITQLEATLEGRNVDVRLRTNMMNNNVIIWPDSSADDYIHRPNYGLFDNMCYYEMTMWYKKRYKTFREMDANDHVDDDDHEDDATRYESRSFTFSHNHPGRSFSNLTRLRIPVIPKVSLPSHKLCNIEDLQLNSRRPSVEALACRQDYAKMALLMFYPFRSLEELKPNGSYWETFNKEREAWIGQKTTNSPITTRFWPKGFEILQNIQDRQTLEKQVKRARDPITKLTTCEQPDDSDTKSPDSNTPNEKFPDILQFCGR